MDLEEEDEKGLRQDRMVARMIMHKCDLRSFWVVNRPDAVGCWGSRLRLVKGILQWCCPFVYQA